MTQDQELHALLHSNKTFLLDSLRKALADAGLDQFDLDSVKLYVKRGPRRCPDGKAPVWEPVRKPDGSVVYEWVCK